MQIVGYNRQQMVRFVANLPLAGTSVLKPIHPSQNYCTTGSAMTTGTIVYPELHATFDVLLASTRKASRFEYVAIDIPRRSYIYAKRNIEVAHIYISQLCFFSIVLICI